MTVDSQLQSELCAAPSGVWHACSDAALICEFLLSTVGCWRGTASRCFHCCSETSRCVDCVCLLRSSPPLMSFFDNGFTIELDQSVTIRYDTIGEFNVDWKAEYSALSSTRSQKKKLKQPTPVPL